MGTMLMKSAIVLMKSDEGKNLKNRVLTSR
jgi:hypothetical protein